MFADKPTPWQLGFQDAVSPIARSIIETHNFIMIFMAITLLFVIGLLGTVCFKFRAGKNRVPSTTSHNTLLEIIWITIPVIVVIAVLIPSLRLIYFSQTIPESDLTLKIVGRQWYWSYEYPDNGGIEFDSYMKQENELKEGELRLLEVDNEVVLPINTNIRLQITASDVIHSWAVPSFGIKTDAVPGRLNESWVRIEKEGTYYGQCSELCGAYHAFMPIKVRAVSKEAFQSWVAEKK